MGFDYIIYIGITLAIGALGAIVSARLQSKFDYYSKINIPNGLTGADIARKMLKDNGIYDVQVIPSDGHLSDHYNPLTKTVALSPMVYQGRSVSAAAVASHECGHAVQHATAYSMLTLRSKMVPVVQFATQAQGMLMFGMMMGGMLMHNTYFLVALVAVFGITALFSLITLPVEFDASRRALAWLDSSRTAIGVEHDGAYDALKWAAMTYVVAAVGAVATFLFFLLKLLNSNRE